MFHAFYHFECQLFQKVNRHFDKRLLNLFFRSITHFGGARLTIAATLLLLLFSPHSTSLTAVSSALALTASHIPVHIAKQLLPRKRPYLTLDQIMVLPNPLQDPSFPSGHTTAIFSVIIPYVLFMPSLAVILLPMALCVGLSRIYLGLHYPSDVIAGGVLGALTGAGSFYLLCM
ncbi:phosphatase PAP2 family protein [Neobacillus endophyticus]|uniref:phosphatase PAP2 family protein n=1 Tax=Neobacillus endophyticus TaxID=2738405 RepID=UPI0035E4673F